MKNSKCKRILAFLLAFIMIFTVAPTVFATDNLPTEDESLSGETTLPEGDTSTDETEQEENNGAVATLTLASQVYVWPVSGHTWLYVENLTDEPMQVGLYTVPAGEGVSLGTFSFSVFDGWGIYYNLECYRTNRDEDFYDCTRITTELDATGLERLNAALMSYPNMWGLYMNCMGFAFAVWNAVTGDFFVPLILPPFALFQVMAHSDSTKGLKMCDVPAEKVYKQRGNGNSAYLEPVGSWTLSL